MSSLENLTEILRHVTKVDTNMEWKRKEHDPELYVFHLMQLC